MLSTQDIIRGAFLKLAADQQDVNQAQINQMNLQANPLASLLPQLAMKQPPMELNDAAQIAAKNLVKALQVQGQTGDAITDPLIAQNSKMKVILENRMLRQQLKQIEQMESAQAMQEMMSGGQPMMGGQPQQDGEQQGAPEQGNNALVNAVGSGQGQQEM